jgi:hypothetical protein
MKMCKCEEGTLVKILPSNGSPNSFNGEELRLSSISSSKEMDEYVVMQSQMYKLIFKKRKIMSSDRQKRLSIVKICCNGKSIHRAFRSESTKDFNKGFVGLSTHSIYMLSQEKELPAGTKIYLSKGSWWMYYWNNPNSAVMMSFRIGVIGILITLAGVNLTNLCQCVKYLIHWISCLLAC